MISQEIAVGGIVMLLSGMLIINQRLFLEKTGNGARFIRWFGPDRAVWVLRGLAIAAMIFGGLLATGVIHPVKW